MNSAAPPFFVRCPRVLGTDCTVEWIDRARGSNGWRRRQGRRRRRRRCRKWCRWHCWRSLWECRRRPCCAPDSLCCTAVGSLIHCPGSRVRHVCATYLWHQEPAQQRDQEQKAQTTTPSNDAGKVSLRAAVVAPATNILVCCFCNICTVTTSDIGHGSRASASTSNTAGCTVLARCNAASSPTSMYTSIGAHASAADTSASWVYTAISDLHHVRASVCLWFDI